MSLDHVMKMIQPVDSSSNSGIRTSSQSENVIAAEAYDGKNLWQTMSLKMLMKA